jgi:hypothetical protein
MIKYRPVQRRIKYRTVKRIEMQNRPQALTVPSVLALNPASGQQESPEFEVRETLPALGSQRESRSLSLRKLQGSAPLAGHRAKRLCACSLQQGGHGGFCRALGQGTCDRHSVVKPM